MAMNRSDLRRLVDEILADGVITAEERELLYVTMFEDGRLDDAELGQLTRIARLLERGRIQIQE